MRPSLIRQHVTITQCTNGGTTDKTYGTSSCFLICRLIAAHYLSSLAVLHLRALVRVLNTANSRPDGYQHMAVGR